PVTPRFLVDRRTPMERRGVEAGVRAEAVVCAVERRVADLGRLELLVQPQRDDAAREEQRLEAHVNRRASRDLEPPGEHPKALHAPQILVADAALHVTADLVDGPAEALEIRLFGLTHHLMRQL